MEKSCKFEYPIRGYGRPQILLVGNGLERKSGQVAWKQLVDNLTMSNCIPLTEDERNEIPFPLLYEVLAIGTPIPQVLDEKSINDEEKRLKTEMEKLVNSSNELLDMLPKMNADHIFTTNYSYCLEKAFFQRRDFKNGSARTKSRFNLMPPDEFGKQKRENVYRLHSGYLAYNSNSSKVGLWHIHGEIGASTGIVLGHDRYGRLLKRIVESCDDIDHKKLIKNKESHIFSSWPELFLFGDIYVIGFGYEQCEFDLWWLLRRKQRERKGDGTVYFYDKNITMKKLIDEDACDASVKREEAKKCNEMLRKHNRSVRKKNLRDKLLLAHGVKIMDCGSTNETDYDEFYIKTFADVRNKIEESRRS